MRTASSMATAASAITAQASVCRRTHPARAFLASRERRHRANRSGITTAGNFGWACADREGIQGARHEPGNRARRVRGRAMAAENRRSASAKVRHRSAATAARHDQLAQSPSTTSTSPLQRRRPCPRRSLGVSRAMARRKIGTGGKLCRSKGRNRTILAIGWREHYGHRSESRRLATRSAGSTGLHRATCDGAGVAPPAEAGPRSGRAADPR